MNIAIHTISNRNRSEIIEAAKTIALFERTKRRSCTTALSASQIEALLAQDGFSLVDDRIAFIRGKIRFENVFLIALYEGAVVAVAFCQRIREFADDIESFVHPNYRELGIESQLIQSLEKSTTVRKSPPLGDKSEPPAAEAANLAGKSMFDIERLAISQTLSACKGSKREAARVLGITRSGLDSKIRKLGMKSPETSSKRNSEALAKSELEAALAMANGNKAEAARQLKIQPKSLYRRMKRLGVHPAVGA